MTADHLFPILENERDSMLLVEMASSLATGNVPSEIIDGIRLGRMTAFQKPDGGVRGIVVGDNPPVTIPPEINSNDFGGFWN